MKKFYGIINKTHITKELKLIVIVFLIWRTVLFAFSFIGGTLLSFNPRFPYSEAILIPSGLPSFIWTFANFDGVHYLTIAKGGYSAQFTQVFFPFYPILVGIISKIIPFLNPILTGISLSSIFFLLTLIVFIKLLKLDFTDKISWWALLFLVLFPTSFYFGSMYTESLFMFLVLLSFFSARKGKWLIASIFAMIACLTRLNGILLLPALIIELWQQQKKRSFSLRIINTIRNPILYLIPVGLLIYMIYLQIYFHDALYFWHAQPIFGAERSGSSLVLFPQVMWRYIKIFNTATVNIESQFISSLEFIFAVNGFIILFIGYLRRIRLSYLVFSFLSLLLPTLTGTFSSMTRYTLLAFPVFILAGMIKSNFIKLILLFLSVTLLFILTVLFTSGHWVG